MKGFGLLALLAPATPMLRATDVPAAHRQLQADFARAVAAHDRAQTGWRCAGPPAGRRLRAGEPSFASGGQGRLHSRQHRTRLEAPAFVAEQEIVRHWRGGATPGGMTTLQGMSDGAPFKVRQRFADIWRKRDGRWQVVHAQASRIPAMIRPLSRLEPAEPGRSGLAQASLRLLGMNWSCRKPEYWSCAPAGLQCKVGAD